MITEVPVLSGNCILHKNAILVIHDPQSVVEFAHTAVVYGIRHLPLPDIEAYVAQEFAKSYPNLSIEVDQVPTETGMFVHVYVDSTVPTTTTGVLQ